MRSPPVEKPQIAIQIRLQPSKEIVTPTPQGDPEELLGSIPRST
ncbi:hypothetical protein ACP3TH_05710 [Desulforudis sp. 1031]